MGEVFRKKLGGVFKVGAGVGGAVILAGMGWSVWKAGEGWINPLGSGRIKRSSWETEVVGFLPTWMVGKTRKYCNEVKEIIFLGIEADGGGNLVWDLQSKKIGSEDYLKLKNDFSACGGKNIVGIKLFEDKKLKKLIANPEARSRLVDQVKAVVETGRFDGVNIDFEFQGDPFGVLEDEFVQFINEFRAADLGELSIDVFANTIIKAGADSLRRLVGAVDRVIVMAYDFHRPGSLEAGPVAPIGSPVGERNITEVIERIISLNLDKRRIVLAYPLYGYEWKTETNEFGSRVEEYVQMWSFSKTQISNIKNQNFNDLIINWDEVSMTPWATWKVKSQKSNIKNIKVGKKWVKKTEYYWAEEIHQIYYENERSLKAKVDLAKQTQVGGVGFWALGYEGLGDEVWRSIGL